MLSLRCIMTTLPMTAALSAAHLAALQLPPALRRLYIARDLDPAGHIATARLADRARDAGIEALVLSSRLRGFQRRSPPPRHRPSSGGLARAARARGFQPVCSRRIGGREREMRPGGPAFAPCRFERGSRLAGKDRAHGLLSGRLMRQAARARNGVRRLFSAASGRSHGSRCHGNHAGRFASRNKIAAARRPPLRFGRCRCARRCRPGPPAARGRHEGRDGRGQSNNRRTP